MSYSPLSGHDSDPSVLSLDAHFLLHKDGEPGCSLSPWPNDSVVAELVTCCRY